MKDKKPTPERTQPTSDTIPDGFVDAKSLLPILFPIESCRPCLRTFERMVKAKTIPSIKLRHFRYFHPATVKEALLALQVGGLQSKWRNN